jgi:cytochrome d ubiquinol oxidase subunit I
MDVLFLSRLQFAVATYFHFLFVPLTLGLSLLIALMLTKYARTGDEMYRRMARYWGKFFMVNFVVGVVTGITLEFQFGTNWSRYSSYVGDIFGSLLAIEATATFFLESTFVAVWWFGWNRRSPKAHAVSIWLVAIASQLSAVWILIANSWMQHPVGYVLRNGRAELSNFVEIVTQKYAVLTVLHTVGAAYILTGFFIMAISAYNILRRQHVEFFTKSFRMALAFALIFSIFEVVEGHMHGGDLVDAQPAKMAALEAHWETSEAAPVYLFYIPDAENERNSVQFGAIPGVMSLLAHHSFSAEVKGLRDFPKDERPPVGITAFSFRLMVTLGALFVLLTVIAWLKRNQLTENPWLLRIMLYAVPLPYIACALGWTVAEVGRQPWIVYGLMKTSDAVSPIATSQVATTLIGFIVVYTLIGVVAFSLYAQYARKGPEENAS